MRFQSGKFLYSPSDLITFMESPFASWMEKVNILDHSFQELMDETLEMTLRQHFGLPVPEKWKIDSWIQSGAVYEYSD